MGNNSLYLEENQCNLVAQTTRNEAKSWVHLPLPAHQHSPTLCLLSPTMKCLLPAFPSHLFPDLCADLKRLTQTPQAQSLHQHWEISTHPCMYLLDSHVSANMLYSVVTVPMCLVTVLGAPRLCMDCALRVISSLVL